MTEVPIEACADLAAEAAADIAETLGRAIAQRGQARFVATGGRTPEGVYRRLSAAPLDWPKVAVTLSDERWVDTDSPDSNEHLVRQTLLQGSAAAAAFTPLKSGGQTPEADAARASIRLADLGPFDHVLLGMGEDGHIASLFPKSPVLAGALNTASPACIAVPMGEGTAPPQARLTLTYPVFAAARRILLIVTGQAKREVLERALAGYDPFEFPVRAVLQGPAPVRILWSA